jgi:hypothetical protein
MELILEQPTSDVSKRVAMALIGLGCPLHYSGYQYLKDGMTTVVQNGGQQLDKSIYVSIAEHFRTTQSSVERCIRTLLKFWWPTLKDMGTFKTKPTARELIFKCAELVMVGKLPNNAKGLGMHEEYESVYEILYK